MDDVPNGNNEISQQDLTESRPKMSTKDKPTFWLVVSVLAVTFGSSCQYGYGIGVLTGPSSIIQQFYNQSNYERHGEHLSDTGVLWLWSTTISIWCIGGAFGAMAAGYVSDKFGRKGSLLIINIFSLVASLLFGFSEIANSFEMVIMGRLIHGFYVGTAITIVPLYLAEVSPLSLRGAIGTIHQLMITIGILIGQALGLFAFKGEDKWPVLLGLIGIMSGVQLLVLPFCPESPRWLLLCQGKSDKCKEALEKLRGTDDVADEMNEIRMEGQKESEERAARVGILDVIRLKNPDWKMPLIICMVLHGGQQLSGINAVLFYATEIYDQTGMGADEVAYSTVGTGSINVAMTIISVYMVERAGRRILFIIPFALIAGCLAMLTVSINLQDSHDWMKWLSLAFIFFFIISFAIGPGPIPFVIVPELWSQAPRPAAMSIAVQTNWWCNFLVGLIFPYLQASIGAFSFLIFMFFVILTTIFSFFFVPETKNRTFEDITSDFRKEKKVKGKEHYELQDNPAKL